MKRPAHPQTPPPQAPVAQTPPPKARGLAAWARTFESLGIPSYRWYWLGTASAFLGMQMQWPAQSWLAYELTDSALMLGLVSAAWGVPMLLLSLHGGAMADRIEKRRLLVLSQVLMGVLNLVVALLITLDVIEFWHLMVVAALSGTVFAFNMPARQAIIPELVPRKSLFNAIVLSSGAMNATRVLGPAVAGVLMAAMGVDGAFYVSVAFTLAAAAFLLKLPATGPERSTSRRAVSSDIFEGLRYIRAHPIVMVLLSMALALVLLGMPYQNLMPVFAKVLDVEELGFGFLMAMTGVGALIGSLAIASMGDFKRKGALTLASGIALGATLILFANAPSIALALPALLATGAASTGFMSVNNTLIQMNIPDDVRGRVMSVYMMTFGLMPLGVLPASAIADSMGADVAVTIEGAVLVAFVLALAVFRRDVRRL